MPKTKLIVQIAQERSSASKMNYLIK